MSEIMSTGLKIGSKSSHSSEKKDKIKAPSITSKRSVTSGRSRFGSYLSAHGSRFGRSVCKHPKRNDPEMVLTLSTSNSRVISPLYDFKIERGSKFPDLTVTEATESIRQLGNALNVLDYEFNYASFWVLDTLAQCLAEIQLNGFSLSHQKVFLGWFSYVLRCVSLSGAAREDMFMHLQKLFKKAVDIIEEVGNIPYPADIKADSTDHINPKLSADLSSIASLNSDRSVSSKKKTLSKKSSNKPASLRSNKRSIRSSPKESLVGSNISISAEDKAELKLKDFYRIIEILYKVFADRFKYSVIDLAYSAPAITVPVDIPFEFNEIKLPKPVPVVLSPTKDQSSKRKKSDSKGSKKSKRKGKKSKSSVNMREGKSGKRKKSTSKSKAYADVEDESHGKTKSRSKLKTYAEAATEEKSNKQRLSRSKSRKSIGTAAEDKRTKDSKQKSSKTKTELSTKVKEDDNEEKSSKRISPKGKKGEKLKKRSKSADAGINNYEEKNIIKKGEKSEKKRKTSKSNSLKYTRRSMKLSLGIDGESEVDKIFQARAKLFERAKSPETQLEQEKIKSMNDYILPLTEAVDEKFVENLIKTLLPPEVEKEKVKEDYVADCTKKKKASNNSKYRVKSKKSSLKGGKSKKSKNKEK